MKQATTVERTRKIKRTKEDRTRDCKARSTHVARTFQLNVCLYIYVCLKTAKHNETLVVQLSRVPREH